MTTDVPRSPARWGTYQKEKRLKTVVDDIFPTNIRARVVIVGTVTMPGSIMHDIVKQAKGSDDAPQWVRDRPDGRKAHQVGPPPRVVVVELPAPRGSQAAPAPTGGAGARVISLADRRAGRRG